MDEGRVEEILRLYEKLDDDTKESLIYRFDRNYNIKEYYDNKFNDCYKKFKFIGKDYFGKTILDKEFYAKSEEELLENIKNSPKFMFRTKKELLKVAYGDGFTDEEFEEDIEAEVVIHRRYSKCIVSNKITEV